MGCESSQSASSRSEVKVSIIDSGFMKPENESIRKEMKAQKITFECFISLECFLDEFSKRYYNRVITNLETYFELKLKLQELNLFPNIYVILDGQSLQDETKFHVTKVNKYSDLVDKLKQNEGPRVISGNEFAGKKYPRKVDVKILTKMSSNACSNSSIFEAALKKSNFSYQFYNSFQEFERSVYESSSDYVVTDYIFHQEVIGIIKNTKKKIICLCTFEEEMQYPSEIYTYSNNCLDIVSFLKTEAEEVCRGTVKCSKIFLCTNGLPDECEITNTIEKFQIEVNPFDNFETFIKDAVYYFCVTVLCTESEAKNLSNYLEKNSFYEKVKILTIPSDLDPTPKGMFKIIRNIKKGYPVIKGTTYSVDIIDKHYDDIKFAEIKKELNLNEIKCFGYNSLAEYIKNKKMLSSFIICNYDERNLLIKYTKQVDLRAKIIIFCNKNKITTELETNANFSFVSSHFGKIIKFIKKTPVFLPNFKKEEDVKFKEKIDKLKMKNKRISAIKWSGIEEQNVMGNVDGFEFLNIAKDANHSAIREIEKNVASIWKLECAIVDFQKFKAEFINSLTDLWKIRKITFDESHFKNLVENLKSSTLPQVLEKVKTFFDADNELGLQINKSLMKTETLEKKEIANMREFILLIFLNFFSGYQIPRIGKRKLSHWTSNPLIEECEINSTLFCKHFMIFYQENTSKIDQLGKYKIELELEYNSLTETEHLLNNFISYKDKIVFSPFSQFQLQSIIDNGKYKTVTLKHVKNTNFLKEIYTENILQRGQSLTSFAEKLKSSENSFVDENIKAQFSNNVSRVKALQHFEKGEYEQAAEIHKKLIEEIENKENLDSVLVNELNFELATFLYKSSLNRPAGKVISELLESDPGEYIKNECNKMIEQVVDENHELRRRVSVEAMKAFLELQEKQEREEENDEIRSSCKNTEEAEAFIIEEEEIKELENKLKCMEVLDIDGLDDLAEMESSRDLLKS